MKLSVMPNKVDEIEDEQVQPVLDTLRLLTGITIPVQKKTMVLFRLRKRLVQLKHPPLPDYLATLRHDKKEQQVFINLLTTNETSFFRTKRVWDFFQDEWLPQFHKQNGSATLKAWSAAASTGEEAASIAMACLDFQLRQPGFRFQVLATDVDTDVLAKAESGCFREVSVSRLRETHPTCYQRYFKPSPNGMYRMDAKVMRSIRFAVHNLMTSPIALMPQDVVFLRNVLIYFREEEQGQIIQKIAECLNPGSLLILGESECLTASNSLFTFVKPQIYRRTA
jgi:chemotaxis protein methyltransferase CheR